MARNVEDLALLLSVMAGPDSRVPISIEQSAKIFTQSISARLERTRASPSLQDLELFEVDSEIAASIEKALPIFNELNLDIEQSQSESQIVARNFYHATRMAIRIATRWFVGRAS